MCARYKDMSINEFLNMGITEFNYKLASIPESEPLFKIIKSRTINLSTIKNKDERKYWRELKRINALPDLYIPTREKYDELKSQLKETRFL